jgi:hypothetical protein
MLIITLVFGEKRHFLQKMSKIAENCDHNIDPWTICRVEEHFIFQDQSSKLYHGFRVGSLLRLNQQTVSIVAMIFCCALWMTVLVEKVRVEVDPSG